MLSRCLRPSTRRSTIFTAPPARCACATRAQAILLAAEHGWHAAQIAPIVRMSAISVLRWIKRYNAEGLEGLFDAPRPGKPKKASAAYRARLLEVVRRRPRSLSLEFSLWTLRRLQTTWPKRPASASRMRASGAIFKQTVLCCPVLNIRLRVQIRSTRLEKSD